MRAARFSPPVPFFPNLDVPTHPNDGRKPAGRRKKGRNGPDNSLVTEEELHSVFEAARERIRAW